MALITAFGGIQMISIAILGEYLWRNFDQTRDRPMFIIQNSNLKDKE
jgi:dolichol-phosphate mannosyltransferase